ncbi:MAG: 2,3-diketo-L-gulonate-binding periplasmic protein YiaO precursor [Smithella sp. PtaU1.Bin162]|nr:MAG: 2,3-diketo-L-gulonate-binding periplasmic protein YiaO precursor [Smithella sp. PtaU1.Bin162]
MKKLKLMGLLVLVVMLATLSMGFVSKASAADKWVLKGGHVAAASHAMNLTLIEMGKQMEQRTGGRVKFDVFPEAAIGGEREMIEGARIGTVDFALTTSAVLGNFVPEMKLFDLPFLFKDRDNAIRVLDGPIGQKLLDSMTAKGLIGLAFWENGFRNLTNSKRPINKPEDLKNLKMRTMENPIHLESWRTLGANPTPMAFAEVYTALQQGTVDGQENPLAIIYTTRLYEVQKYLSMTNHNYSPMVLMVSKKLWDTFPADIKTAFKELAMTNANVERGILKTDEAKYLADMQKAGLKVNYPDTALFREKVKSVYDKHSKAIGADIINQILKAK